MKIEKQYLSLQENRKKKYLKNFDAGKNDDGLKVVTKMTEQRLEVSEYIPVQVEGEVKDRE